MSPNRYLIILALILGVASYFLAQELISARAQLINISSKLETTQKALAEVTTLVAGMKSEQIEYDKTLRRIQNTASEQERRLNGLKNREDTVLAKPGLVQLKINKAFNKHQSEMACLSGDDKLCER